jgi:cytochrome c556
MKSSLRLLIAAAGFTLASSAAFAGADDIIKARQACMKANGAAMGTMVPMMKGEKPYWDKWWAADAQAGATVETFAKPEIWTDAKGWTDASAAWYAAFTAVKASTDEASFKAAFPALGGSCQGCHEKFRRPKA